MTRAFYYSIRRRFLNKHSLILLSIIIFISSILFFFDVISNRFLDEDYQIPIQSSTIDTEFIDDYPLTEYKKDARIKIDRSVEGYTIQSKENLHEEEKEVLRNLIDTYHRSLYPELIYNVEFKLPNKDHSNHYAYMNTFLYFFMLNFSAMMVHEVIAEKENNILEYLSTIISPYKIFNAKILMGVFSVVFQLFLYCFVFCILILIRNYYDQGKGILKLLYRWGICSKQYSSFAHFFKNISWQWGHVLSLLFYLISSLYLVQMFMLSSTISSQNIEEASMIQGPFYLCLLFLYYFCMILERKKSRYLNIFAYCPLFSSLLAPQMIYQGKWGVWQQVFSLSSHCLILYFLRKICSKRYVKGMFVKK